MLDRQGAVLETLLRIQRFLEDFTAMFGAVNQSEARKRLDDTVTQIGSHAVAQVGGHRTSQGETARQQLLRLALRNDHMRPIAVIASQKLREQPEFTKLLLPPVKVLGPMLTAAARHGQRRGEVHRSVRQGRARGRLRCRAPRGGGCTRSVDGCAGQEPGAAGRRDQGTPGRNGAGPRADPATRLVVRPKLGTNEELLREWEVASHIKRSRTPQSTTSDAAPSATAITPASPAPTAA